MNDIEEYSGKTFEDIKHIDEYGNEYWRQENYNKFWVVKSGDIFPQL